MTLNITVLGRDTIYQSADYQLYNTRSKKPLEIRSTKVIVVDNIEWTGFITYTGVGRVGKKDTAEIVEEWIEGSHSKSFNEIVELIRVSATEWFRKINVRIKHTFVVAAFEDGTAKAAIISNFQKYHGKHTGSIKREFFVSEVKADSKTQVIVTGNENVVPRFRKKLIQHLVDSNEIDPSRIRRVIANTNSIGAKKLPDLISQDCFVYSQRVDGTGHYEPFGNTPATPVSMLGGESILRNLFKGKVPPIKGMSTQKFGKASKKPIRECNLQITEDSRTESYKVIQLDLPDGMKSNARCYNDKHKVVAGLAKPSQDSSYYPCIWEDFGELKFLKNNGGLTGKVNYTSGDYIVGSVTRSDNNAVACKWTYDEQFVEIGKKVAKHSEALACDDQGNIVGCISIHESKGGQQYFRPALWQCSGDFKIMRDLSGGWGVAVDIDEQIGVLVRVHSEFKSLKPSPARPLLWTKEDKIEIGLPNINCYSLYPKKITNDGGIIGSVQMENGTRTAYRWDSDGSWTRLFDPIAGGELKSVNKSGTIVGCEMVDKYSVPWIKLEEGTKQRLPYFLHHHHNVFSISDDGVVVGSASSDLCSHPIAWIPKKT